MSRHQSDYDFEFPLLENDDLAAGPMGPEDALSTREIFMQDHNCCCLCGEQLNFKHQVDFLQLTVIESASCDACKIKLRKQLFTLQ